MSKKLYLLIFLLSILVSFCLYFNTVNGNFVFDDTFFNSRANELSQPSSLSNIWLQPFSSPTDLSSADTYRPFTMATFALNYILFGKGPQSFHVTNIILNGLVIFLVFLLTFKLFGKKEIAIFTALIFAFLPIHTEAVAFIKSRDELLGAVFVLTAWLVFIRAVYREKINYFWLLLSSLVLFVSILSKEFTIVSPAIFMLVYFLQKKTNFKSLFKIACVYIPVILLCLLMRSVALGWLSLFQIKESYPADPIAYVNLVTRFWTVFKMLFLYVGKTFVPVNLSATYRYNALPLSVSPFDVQTILGVAILTALLTVILWKRFRHSPLAIGSLIFLITYFPFSKFIFTGGEYFAEHWMYLPSFGLAIVGGYVAYEIFRRQRLVAFGLMSILLVLYAFILIPRNTVWLSEESLYKSMVQTAPDSMFSNLWLGRYYVTRQEFQKAKPYILKAHSIYPGYSLIWNGMASIAYSEKDYPQAEYDIQQSITLYKAETSYSFYAFVLAKEGKYQESLDIINSQIPKLKNRTDVMYLLAVDYYKLGKIEQAKQFFGFNYGLTEVQKIKIINAFNLK